LHTISDITLFSRSEFSTLAGNFDCNENNLNTYIKQFAYKHASEGLSQTYLIHKDNTIIAYVTLSISTVSDNDGHYEETKRNCDIPESYRFPMPALKIARLATGDSFKKRGYGSILLSLAKIKSMVLQITGGCRLITVDARKDAMGFYRKQGFYCLSSYDDEETVFMFSKVNPVKSITVKYLGNIKEFCSLYCLNAELETIMQHVRI